VASTSATSLDDGGLAASSAHLYYVRAVSGTGATADSATDPATTVMFTDDPLVTGMTKVKGAHILELRTAVNAMRALAGLPAATFTDASLTRKAMKTVHVTQLRDALDEARDALGVAPVVFSDATLTPGSPMKAAHIQELREGVR
jgi:hypothetical protein